MKIRSQNELIDFLASQKQERKRELISLSQDLAALHGQHSGRTTRTAILLSYAHWEGFVREAGRAYVAYVAHKSRRLSNLTANFQALACREELFVGQGASHRIAPHLAVVTRFVDEIDHACSMNPDKAIDTESNLNTVVLKNICLSVGIDYEADWATDGHFIDDLVENRCAVAHGELFTPKIDYATEVIEFTVKAIDRFSNAIENAAIQCGYLRQTA